MEEISLDLNNNNRSYLVLRLKSHWSEILDPQEESRTDRYLCPRVHVYVYIYVYVLVGLSTVLVFY